MTGTTEASESDAPEPSISDESEQFVLKKLRGTLNDVWNHKNPCVDLIVKMTPTRPAFERIPDEGCILPEVHFSPFQGIPADNYVETVINIESSDEDEDFVTWRNRNCDTINYLGGGTIDNGNDTTMSYFDGGTIDQGNIPGSSRNDSSSSSSNSDTEISGGIKESCNSQDGGQEPLFSLRVPRNFKRITQKECSSDILCKTIHETEHSVENLTPTSKSIVYTQTNPSKAADTYHITNTSRMKMLIAKGKEQCIQTPDKDTFAQVTNGRCSQVPCCPRNTPVRSNSSRWTSSSETAYSNRLPMCSTPVITTQKGNRNTMLTSHSSPKTCVTQTKIRSKVTESDVERMVKGMGAVKQLKKQQKEKRSKEIAKKQKEPPPRSYKNKEKAKLNNVSTTKEVDEVVSKLLVSQKKMKYVRKENNQEGVEFIIPKKKPALRSTAIQMIRDSYDDDDFSFHRLNEMHKYGGS